MKTNTLFAAIALGLAVLYTPLASAQWTDSKRAPTVYNAGTDNSVFFTAPVGASTSASITSVSWNIIPYTNGSPTQTYTICYAQPYTSAYNLCWDVSNSLSGTTNHFNNQLVRGSQFRITVNLTGGGNISSPTRRKSILFAPGQLLIDSCVRDSFPDTENYPA